MIALALMLAAAAQVPTNSRIVAFESGNSLLQACTASEMEAVYYQYMSKCSSYISGAHDAYNLVKSMKGPGYFCSSTDLTLGQVRDVTIKFLKDHPELRHYGAANIVASALREAFPCATQR